MTAFNALGTHPPLPVRANAPSNLHTGKVFLVTGAAGGVGASMVELLVSQGAMVVAADLDAQKTAAATDGLGSKCLAVALDVSDPASVAVAIEKTMAWQGRLDGVVSAAAIALHQPPLDTNFATWRRQFDVNVVGSYLIATAAAKTMIAAGTHGAIVMIASEAGKLGHPETLLAYSATKAAVINMTRMLSAALAANDINVNCVCPGSVATPMLREVARIYSDITGQSADDIFAKMISSQLKRHTTASEVARTISFLLSDDAMLIRGQAINVDGGDTPY
jgi:NAD(P)-dependent dehydrogenase (short-subunit alcohol dehydrogenase family)